MKIRYTIIAALILLTLAFARGVVVVPHAGDFSILSTLHAFADDSGDGGDGGDTGGDSGDTGNTGGDSGDTGSTTTGGEAPGGTTPTPVPGVCNTTTFNSCSSGTLGANAQQPDGSYHWYCDGVDGGATSPLCVYVPPSAGVCDYTGPNQCTVGTLGNNAVQPDGSYQWYCNSPNGGATSPLCFYVPPVTPTNTIGACNYTQANSCANGTLGAHEIQPDGSYHWYCDGTPNTTENRSPLCFYVPPQTPVNGVCSTVIDSCTSGVPQTPGIQPNGDHHWYCNGTGGGTNSPLCTYAPLKCEITVDKSSVTSGSPVILSWTTNRIINANSTFTISNGVGAANVNGGSTTVNPVVTTTYRGTLYDNLDFSPRLEATCSATVTVTNPPAVTWTPYCTGGNDLNGHNWQIWEVDNSVPPNYRFKEMGSVANGCVPPTVTPSTIKVVKIVINDNSGTKQVADFPLFVNSTSVVSGAINTFTPGSYTVSETNL
ncbi:MAG: hypothetical protein JWN18_1, partial [Parcubacteria group bacterium]|nr:hypothetical protein [Parcubacteria group bacterium]